MVGDPLAVHIQAGEERLVQQAAYDLTTAGVGSLGFGEQDQRVIHNLPTQVQAVVGALGGALDVSPLLADRVDLAAELVFGPAFLGGQIEEVALLLVESFQTLDELVAHVIGQAVVAVERFVDAGAKISQSFRGGGQHFPVVADDRLFQDFHRDVRQVAQPFAPPSAEKVVIVAFAVSGQGALYDHAVLAAGTPEQALEVVVVGVLARAGTHVRVEDALHLFEQFLRDQWFVTAGVLDSVVGDHADVVVITEHHPQAFVRDGAGGPLGVAGHAEARLGELGVQ